MIKFLTLPCADKEGYIIINVLRIAYMRTYLPNKSTAICFSEVKGDYVVVELPIAEVVKRITDLTKA